MSTKSAASDHSGPWKPWQVVVNSKVGQAVVGLRDGGAGFTDKLSVVYDPVETDGRRGAARDAQGFLAN